MRYGYFDDQDREYVITQPDTPLPWINYLGNQDYFGLLSNTGGGYTFYKDARLRRLTRYRYNNAPLDMGGRYIYLRAEGPGGSPEVWSPTWMPVRQPLDVYECRHGLGYSKIRSEYHGVAAEICYFVPLGENLEIWDVRITNRRQTGLDLSLFSAIEFCLWDANDDATNFQRNYSIGEVEVEWNGQAGTLPLRAEDWPERHTPGGVIYHKTEYRERRNHFAFFACSEPLAGFDTQRDNFLGAYRGWDQPEAVERGQAGDSIAHGWQPVGSHQVQLHLQPGEEKRILFTLGYHENPVDEKFEAGGYARLNKTSVRPVIAAALDPRHADRCLEDLKAYWEQLLGKLQVNSPDIHTNRMVNIWNAYQCMVTFNMSRSASYFESGVGRGMGFRDSNQDLLGFVHMIPERARERLLDLAATQLPNGGADHQYQPLTKRGNKDIGGDFNDDPLWLVLAVTAYVKESGDWSILEEPVTYDNQPGSEAPLFEHLERAIRFTLEHIGPHGLPLIGHADWNDCLNLNCFSDSPGQSFQMMSGQDGKVAESVLIAGLFLLAGQEMINLMRTWQVERGSLPAAVRISIPLIEDRMAVMTDKVWEAGWDGEWFRRAYDHFSRPVGSKENEEGQIFIEPQGICVMAGLGVSDGRAQQALDAVAQRLATPHGIVLQQPAFGHYYLNLGEISSYPPGYKENAGIFCHTNPWIMIAETCIGRGDRAFDYYQRINPSAREAISDIHRCEPYVYAQMIAGKDAPTHGEAKNSWLSGTAAWNFVAITQSILGIRPTYTGLEIAPVIPTSWPGFDAVREFREARYEIHVERRGVGNTVALRVNGEPLDGRIVPLAEPGSVVRVQVELS